MVGTHVGSYVPSGVYISTVLVYEVKRTCPVGSMSIRPSSGMIAVFAGLLTCAIAFVPGSYSNAEVGGLNPAGVLIGPAVKSTLPLGNRQAGPSTAPWA